MLEQLQGSEADVRELKQQVKGKEFLAGTTPSSQSELLTICHLWSVRHVQLTQLVFFHGLMVAQPCSNECKL